MGKPRYMTVKTAAELLKTTEDAILKGVRDGLVPASGPMIDRAWVEALVQADRVPVPVELPWWSK